MRPGWMSVLAAVVGLAGVASWRFPPRAAVEVTRALVTEGPIEKAILALGTVEPASDAAESRPADCVHTVPAGSPARAAEEKNAPSERNPASHEMQVRVRVNPEDLSQLVLFQPATFSVPAYPRRVFRGVFSGITTDPAASSEDREGASPPHYTAIVEVGDPDGTLQPEMPATVALPGERRPDVIRIPNTALTFMPPPSAAQDPPEISAATTADDADGAATQWQTVWSFDGARFHGIALLTGLADDEWTELVRGSLRPGDLLVTSATAPAESGF